MPLQNRVTPFGEIVADDGRGLMMGNRGVVHDEGRRIVRPWQVRRWIACRLEYRGVRRTLMRPRSWTELFFLDEAAAFSAGHRPCAFCRRADYNRFCAAWRACIGDPATADPIDRRLHAERLTGRAKRTYRAELGSLPDGTFITLDGTAWLVWGESLFAWSAGGYTSRRPRPRRLEVEVLTPRSIVAVFAAGYRPSIHASVDQEARG